ncbi:MAG: hypothetical protein WBO73_13750 [Gammaproteobacteria bacterium]|jgi:hypothetical protein
MSHKTSIIVPGLCGPLPEIEGIEQAARPLLELLGRLHRQKRPVADYSTQVAALFGVNFNDRFPDAALSLLAYGIDPGDGCWMHADPVNLEADLDRAILSDSQVLHLREDEAAGLVELINTHFAEDGLTVNMADQNNWFIRLEDCSLATTPLRQAVGRDINHLLPTGDSAKQWRRFLNEVQMLLHTSEVNQRREQRGMAAINSLWFWGEGRLPPKSDTDISHVYADDALTTGLAKHDQIACSPLTDPIALAYAMKHDGHSLVSLNQLDGPCSYGDVSAWLDEMLALVEDWFKPVIETARSLDADVDIYPCNGMRYHFGHNNTFAFNPLKFWKKDRLQDHVDTH